MRTKSEVTRPWVLGQLNGKANAGGDPTKVFAASRFTAYGVNNISMASGQTVGANPSFTVDGAAVNIGFNFTAKGSGELTYRSNNGVQLVVGNTLDAVNYLRTAGALSGSRPTLEAAGTDTNLGLNLSAKGTGTIGLNSGGRATFEAAAVANSVNYLGVIASVAGTGPTLRALGTDTNISLTLLPKGSGSVIVPALLRANALTLTQAAPQIMMEETDQTGAAGLWRLIADAGLLRLDINTDTFRGFATFTSPFTVNAAGVLTVPTPAAGDNSQAAANTAFVQAALAGAGGGGRTLLQEVNAAGLASVALNPRNLQLQLGKTFDAFELEFQGCVPVAASTLSVRFGTWNGSANVVSSSGYMSPQPDAGTPASATSFALHPSNIASGTGYTGTTRIAQPSRAGYKYVLNDGFIAGGTNAVYSRIGFWNSADVVDYIQIFFSTGNFQAGTIRLYGL